MESSTYLFINKKYKSLMSSRKTEKEASSESNISADSLEDEFKKKVSVKNGVSEDVDTILIPFYDNDVLVKVPKEQNWKESNRQGRLKENVKETHSYLVNKDTRKARRTTYLEMFRKQLSPVRKPEPKPDDNEIRSLSPEVGDTERESISGDQHNPTEFYNTESYNEIYYEKLLNQDLENYMDSSYEDVGAKEGCKSPHGIVIENLKSVSEVTQQNRHVRRATVQPIHNVKLGGLGPDVEGIKPRLERARSLQRYSEKVRMENRLRIYKKSVQVENDKVRDNTNHGNSKHDSRASIDPSASYLINKSSQQKLSRKQTRVSASSKSADVKIGRSRVEDTYAPKDKPTNKTSKKIDSVIPAYSVKGKRKDEKKVVEERAKSSTRSKGINTEGPSVEVPPVHINFMVNVGGVRPSSALRNLEEKHRMYQEQVKAFKMDNNENL